MKTLQKKCLFLNAVRKGELYDSNFILNSTINLSAGEIQDLIEWGIANNYIKGIQNYIKNENEKYLFEVEHKEDRLTIHGEEFLEAYYDTKYLD